MSGDTVAVPACPHAELGRDFKPFDTAEPFAFYARARAQAPIFYEPAVRICHVWMELTPEGYMEWVGSEIDSWFFTETAGGLARRELGRSRTALAA